MTKRQPAAFLSYVHSDDDHDDGRISSLRKRLEGEVRMHTGEPFPIFQDRNDLAWGQTWAERINSSLNEVTFLIPIITPSYFRSPACRSEFSTFALREKSLGVNELILPIYYLEADPMGSAYPEGTDEVADVLRARQWSDWRSLRFLDLKSREVSETIAQLAATIKRNISELEGIFLAAGEETKDEEPEQIFTSGPIAPHLDKLFRDFMIDQEYGSKIRRSFLHDLEIPQPRAESAPQKAKASYKIYTTVFDEVVLAKELMSPAEIDSYSNTVAGGATLVETLNQATLRTLADAIPASLNGKSAAVFVLIDNSGSLRGRPVTYTASWVLVLLEILDKIGIKTAAAGFTTRAWKGGQSREKWLAEGMPLNPGRLNDLRYIIYKGFDEPLRTSAPNLGAMLKEGVLKENIDGEAVLWAQNVLSETTADRKLLVVLSDGAPVDDSTLTVNPSDILTKHLSKAVRDLRKTDIDLVAVGIDHDVSRYYGKDGVASSVETLGVDALERILGKLTSRNRRNGSRRSGGPGLPSPKAG